MTYWITQRADKNSRNDFFKNIDDLDFIAINYDNFSDMRNNKPYRDVVYEMLLNPVLPHDTVIVVYPMNVPNLNFISEFIDYLKNKCQARIVAMCIDFSYDSNIIDIENDFNLIQLGKFDLILVENKALGMQLLSDSIQVPIMDLYLSNVEDDNKELKEVLLKRGIVNMFHYLELGFEENLIKVVEDKDKVK